jgi:hypothetical protein
VQGEERRRGGEGEKIIFVFPDLAIALADILHHSQQDQKNRVSQRKIQVFTISHSQETRFFTQVQDLS